MVQSRRRPSLSGETRRIAPLPWRLDGASVVVLAHERYGLVCWNSVDDGETGQGCAGSSTAASAGDFDAFVQGAIPGLGKDVLCLRVVAGQPEVGPAQPPALPWGAGWCRPEEVDSKRGHWSRWERPTQATASNETTGWQAKDTCLR
jgi:hypothetical protein